MKPNSGFLMAMLAACSVANAELVTTNDIERKHLKIMEEHLTPEASETLLDACSTADETGKPCLVKGREYQKTGFSEITSGEQHLIKVIYGHYGRVIEIQEDQMIVQPRARKA